MDLVHCHTSALVSGVQFVVKIVSSLFISLAHVVYTENTFSRQKYSPVRAQSYTKNTHVTIEDVSIKRVIEFAVVYK